MDKNTNLIKVKIVSDTPGRTRHGNAPWEPASVTGSYWFKNFLRNSKGYNEWDNIKLVLGESEDPDYYLIVNHPYIPENKGPLHSHEWDRYIAKKSR